MNALFLYCAGEMKVKKSLYVIGVLISGMILMANANASQEAVESVENTDEIIAMCEETYTVEKYTDEEERNNLIDQCINESAEPQKTDVEGT